MNAEDTFREAFETRDLATFLRLVFPPEWAPLAARILESGASMSDTCVPWAPRWSPISPTVRKGSTPLHTAVKSALYRAHDAIHQLWGLPVPSEAMTLADFVIYKRAQMCGEVAVLTLTEFYLAETIAFRFPELREFLNTRNALPLLHGPLRGKSPAQVAARLDELLHKQLTPLWVRDSPVALAFVAKYVPMLRKDRELIDQNWKLMQQANWRPQGAPNARYGDLSGLELTTWMINDFFHLADTDSVVDAALAEFNAHRRARIQLPKGWA